MFIATLLITAALAHTKLINPAPKFMSPSENDSPTVYNTITYENNSPAKNIVTFTGMLHKQYEGSLPAYFKDCGSNSPKTDHNAEAPMPSNGRVIMDIHSHHPELYEFYIDNILVAEGAWQDGEHPESIPIDYSKCTSGKCKFRYIIAAVHAQPIQLYDNIVTIPGTPSRIVAGHITSQTLAAAPVITAKAAAEAITKSSFCSVGREIRTRELMKVKFYLEVSQTAAIYRERGG